MNKVQKEECKKLNTYLELREHLRVKVIQLPEGFLENF